MDLLVGLWDVFSDSAFFRWFALGALAGLVLVIILLMRGIDLDLLEGALCVLVSGLVAVAARFVRWLWVG